MEAKHTALPREVVEVDNGGDYGGSGPDCYSGFKSFAIADSEGRVLFDSLNRDHHLCEVHEEYDEDGVYAFDKPAQQDAAFIVRACNAHDDLITEYEKTISAIESIIPRLRGQGAHDEAGELACRLVDLRAALAKAEAA
jgi:hypothetical protein